MSPIRRAFPVAPRLNIPAEAQANPQSDQPVAPKPSKNIPLPKPVEIAPRPLRAKPRSAASPTVDPMAKSLARARLKQATPAAKNTSPAAFSPANNGVHRLPTGTGELHAQQFRMMDDGHENVVS